MNFENKLNELEEIVKKLENKDTSLEEGISLYSKGIELTKDCLEILNGGKERIRLLRQEMTDLFNGNDGNDENEQY